MTIAIIVHGGAGTIPSDLYEGNRAGCRRATAVHYAIDLLWERIQGVGGLILLDRDGHVGVAHSSPNIAYALIHEGMNEPIAGIKV